MDVVRCLTLIRTYALQIVGNADLRSLLYCRHPILMVLGTASCGNKAPNYEALNVQLRNSYLIINRDVLKSSGTVSCTSY